MVRDISPLLPPESNVYSSTIGKSIQQPLKYQGYYIEDNRRNPNIFQNAIRPVLILAYNMALFPVQGIEQLEAEKIKFSSKSLPNFISFYPYFGTLVMMLLSLAWFIKKASLLRTLRIIFFGTSWISCALLRELAVHWPQLCRVWAKCEQTTNLGYPTNLTLKCHCFIFIYIMTAVCEHGLALSNAFSEAAACGDALRNLCTHWFPQVFNVVPFYRPLAIIIMTINTIATFTFNFVDLLLITTGYILANLLRQYNTVLDEDSHRIKLPSYYWTVKFQIYNDIISLANIVFGRMSKLLLLSFFISVSSICFQLYFNLTPVERSTVGKIYYVISLTYLVARCLLLCIVLGSVHEEGTKVKRFIHAIPSQSYTPVVERFLLHVNNQSSEFSAFGFFTVTRTTIITIMSIVLSYEAIMHQFKTLMIDVEDGQALKRNASIDCSKYLQLGD